MRCGTWATASTCLCVSKGIRLIESSMLRKTKLVVLPLCWQRLTQVHIQPITQALNTVYLSGSFNYSRLDCSDSVGVVSTELFLTIEVTPWPDLPQFVSHSSICLWQVILKINDPIPWNLLWTWTPRGHFLMVSWLFLQWDHQANFLRMQRTMLKCFREDLCLTWPWPSLWHSQEPNYQRRKQHNYSLVFHENCFECLNIPRKNNFSDPLTGPLIPLSH